MVDVIWAQVSSKGWAQKSSPFAIASLIGGTADSRPAGRRAWSHGRRGREVASVTTTERAPKLTTVPVQLANQLSNDDERASQFKESFVYRPERNAIQQVEGKSAEAMPHLGPEARSPEH